MGKEDRTINIFKDKKHRITFIYGQKGNVEYEYVCGPRTNNLWYRVLEDYGQEVVARIPDGF